MSKVIAAVVGGFLLVAVNVRAEVPKTQKAEQNLVYSEKNQSKVDQMLQSGAFSAEALSTEAPNSEAVQCYSSVSDCTNQAYLPGTYAYQCWHDWGGVWACMTVGWCPWGQYGGSCMP